jgi:hypothetical protein
VNVPDFGLANIKMTNVAVQYALLPLRIGNLYFQCAGPTRHA